MIKLEKNIEDYLWRVLNILRGVLDLGIAKRIALEIIFLTLLMEMKNSKEKNVYKFIEGELRLTYDENSKNEFFDELDKFIDENGILGGVILEVYRLKDMDPQLIVRIQNEIESINFQGDSAEAFRICIDALSNDTKIEFSTAPNVSKLISNLLKGIKAKSIYDPAIGTGCLITEVANKHKKINIYGQDINSDVIKICKMLLILEGKLEDVNNIVDGSTIVNPKHIVDGNIRKFDCIVSEPPFGVKDWGYNDLQGDVYNRFHRGFPPKSMGDYVFITHVVESLNDNGVAVLVEPSGVLFRGGAEGAIREALVNENIVDCVISLPNNMIYGTAIPVNLLILKKNRKKKNVLFIDVLNNVESSKKLTILSDEIINKITDTFENYTEELGFSRVVTIDEIEKNDYNLMVQRYIEEKREKEELNLSKLTLEANELEKKLAGIHSELRKYFN